MEVEQSAWEETGGRRRSDVSQWPAPKEGKAEGTASDNHRGKVRQGRTPNRRAKCRSDRAESEMASAGT